MLIVLDVLLYSGNNGICVQGYTVASPNKGRSGTIFLSFVRRLSSLGDSKCIETIERKYIGTPSCVLHREIILISEHPLLEILLYSSTELCRFCLKLHAYVHMLASGGYNHFES